MFFVSEEYLRRFQETGELGASTLGEAVPLGETLFPEEEEGAAKVRKSQRGPRQAE